MPDDKASRVYRFTFVLIVTGALVAAFLFMVRDFVVDILMAAIFAGLLYPLFQRALPIFRGQRAVTAAVVVAITIVTIVLPLTAIAITVWSEAAQLSSTTAASLRPLADHPETLLAMLPNWLVQEPAFQMLLEWLSSHTADAVSAIGGFVSRELSGVVRGTAGLLIDLFVVFFALIYFLQQGPALIEMVAARMPVSRPQAEAVTGKILRVTAATLKSIVLVGTAQGILIGAGVAAAGLGHPWLWGTLAAVASTVPAVGSSLIWVPATIYLLLTGHLVNGLLFALWSMLSVFVGDTLLRIQIVGRGAAMPGILVFISTLGGITTFGIAGVLIGPVLAGVIVGVLDLYGDMARSSAYRAESAANEPATPGPERKVQPELVTGG